MQIFYYSKNIDKRIINVLGIETEDVINNKKDGYYRKLNSLIRLISDDVKYHQLDVLLDDRHTIDLRYIPLKHDTKRNLIRTSVVEYSTKLTPRPSQLTIKFVW